MTAVSPSLKPVGDRWSGPLLAALFVVAAALIFLFTYYAVTVDQHFWALIIIGFLALLFSLVSYLAESFSRDPSLQRAAAWGFFGMGFAVLFLTVGLGSTYGVLGATTQLLDLAILVVMLFIAVVLIRWRGRAVRATENQMVSRDAWRRETAPSAFDYAAAKSPSVPTTAPPVTQNPPPPRSP